MLTHISIKNFVIVDSLELDFHNQMTVITGETGAGKSIVFDAIGLCLGDRADANMVKAGADKVDISALFDVQHIPAAQQWLQNSELDLDGECILRRVISAEGRSKAFINNTPVPLQKLKELGQHLIEIHGQHAHQHLLKTDRQRDILDQYSQQPDTLKATQRAYQDWQTLLKQAETLAQTQQARTDRLQLISYQIDELNELALTEGEFEQIEEEHRKLAHAQELTTQCAQGLDYLYEDEQSNAFSYINQAMHALEGMLKFDPNLGNIINTLESSRLNLQEAAHELRDYLDQVEQDPEQLHYLDQRLSRIQNLARKHHVEPEQLAQHHQTLLDEQAALQQQQTDVDGLSQAIEAAKQHYLKQSGFLSDKRQQTAEQLSAQVTDSLKALNMADAELKINLQPLEEARWSGYGVEQIQFLVKTNMGQAFNPMQKVVSGGELSRISLAIMVITSAQGNTPTLIFDEVDVGIGGNTAALIGKHLRLLASNNQLLCVTHLPQVACCGHQHYHVEKYTENGCTLAKLTILDQQQRTQELARMLGGDKITDNTLAHAKEMLIA